MKYWNKTYFILKQKKNFFLGFSIYILFSIFILLFVGNLESSKITNAISSPFLDTLFFNITYLGDGLMVLFFLLIVFCYRISFGLVSMVSLLIPILFTQVLKRICFPDFPRPSVVFKDLINSGQWNLIDVVDLHAYMSFPSGHTTTVFSISCIFILFVKNKFYQVPILLIAILTGFSRIYLSQHFLIDVLVGSIIGCLGSFLLYSALSDKFNSLGFSISRFFK